MVKIELVLHPSSLHPLEAARAHHMRYEEEMCWEDIASEVTHLKGVKPSLKGVRNAVGRVRAQQNELVPRLGYS
eukprot:10748499-Karenia_brevis.AAC.1